MVRFTTLAVALGSCLAGASALAQTDFAVVSRDPSLAETLLTPLPNQDILGATGNYTIPATDPFYLLHRPGKPGSAWLRETLSGLAFGQFQSAQSAPVPGPDGAYYGATWFAGGFAQSGAVYRLAPPSASAPQWTLQTLHTFPAGRAGSPPFDGVEPGGIAVAPNGVVYGTTRRGGARDRGLVYKLVPPSPGQTAWNETVLVNLTLNKPGGPTTIFARPIFDATRKQLFWTDGANQLFSLDVAGAGTNPQPQLLASFPPPARGHFVLLSNLVPLADGGFAVERSTEAAPGRLESSALYDLSPPATAGAPWTVTPVYKPSTPNQLVVTAQSLTVDDAGALYAEEGHGRAGGTDIIRLDPSGGSLAATVLQTLPTPPQQNRSGPTFGSLVTAADAALVGQVFNAVTRNHTTQYDETIFRLGTTAPATAAP